MPMPAVASFLSVLLLTLILSRIASTALVLTGMSRDAARFQARSALTGTGFTTRESESVVDHPVRRRIIMGLMLLHYAGLAGAVSSLVLSFTWAQSTHEALLRIGTIAGGLFVLWLLARSRVVDRVMVHAISWALNRWTGLTAHDFVILLDLEGDYTIREIRVGPNSCLDGKMIRETGVRDNAFLILGLRRPGGQFVGAPKPDERIAAGDTLILYGQADALKGLTGPGCGGGRRGGSRAAAAQGGRDACAWPRSGEGGEAPTGRGNGCISRRPVAAPYGYVSPSRFSVCGSSVPWKRRSRASR